MGGGNSQVGFVSLSLSASHIWGFDKYPDPEMKSGLERSSPRFSFQSGMVRWDPSPAFCSEGQGSLRRGLGELSGVLSH